MEHVIYSESTVEKISCPTVWVGEGLVTKTVFLCVAHDFYVIVSVIVSVSGLPIELVELVETLLYVL